MARLTYKRRVFIEEYLKCWSAAEAARRAGYRHPRTMGSHLLTILDVKKAIEARIAELTMSADENLLRLCEQARSDIADFVKVENINETDERGKDYLRQNLTLELPPDKSHLVKSISRTKDGFRIQLYDAQSALALLGKYNRLLTEKHEHDVTVVGIDDVLTGLPGILGEAVRRALADALSEERDKAGS